MAFLVWFWFLALLVLHPAFIVASKQTYIVHMNHKLKPPSYATDREWYTAQLQSHHLQSHTSASPSLLYTYTTAYHGFAASLDSDQAESLRQDGYVLGVYQDAVYNLQTTRTPEFLGLQADTTHSAIPGIKNVEMASMDVIIGVLDSGIWPESKSFDDSYMKPVPARWKGKCESGVGFKSSHCNRKLIGARTFSEGIRSSTANISISNYTPRDEDGHGTHTASTAAGSPVANASFFGYARGTARGMATRARIAVYKVCWRTRCFSSDILAGMDSAIADGVDVLSLSIGGEARPYFEDTLAIGAFSAVERGIFVSCAAGNNGPRRASIVNVAPWITTVGAGTIDRSFPASAVLGNGKSFVGTSLYVGPGITKPVALVYSNNDSNARMCLPGSVQPSFVRGKVVLCDRGVTARAAKGALVRDAGAVGMILANTADNGEGLDADSHFIPTVAVGKKAGDLIRAYVLSERNPTAKMSFQGTVLNVSPAPVVAGFSSRGPNLVTQQILKPDLIAPGSNILAAWSESIGPTGLEYDLRRTKYNIISGTSMSCPHISGLAALVKAAHPAWSPSSIKSALMTSAYTLDDKKSLLRDAADRKLSTPWAHGSGHVDIRRALDPGLVYDIKMKDYIKFLCSLNYSINEVMVIVKDPNVTCSRKFKDPGQINYPSFSVLFAGKRKVEYVRVVSNVGPANSVYNVTVTGPKEVDVTISPARLVFNKAGQTLKYKVTFTARSDTSDGAKFGYVIWRSNKHQVQSAISYQWALPID